MIRVKFKSVNAFFSCKNKSVRRCCTLHILMNKSCFASRFLHFFFIINRSRYLSGAYWINPMNSCNSV